MRYEWTRNFRRCISNPTLSFRTKGNLKSVADNNLMSVVAFQLKAHSFWGAKREKEKEKERKREREIAIHKRTMT